MVRSRGLHTGCAESHRPPAAGQRQRHARVPVPGITSGAGGWSGHRGGAFGEVEERETRGQRFCHGKCATETRRQQQPSPDSPHRNTRTEQMWIWRQVGSLLLPCRRGKEKGRESPTLGHLSGKAACSLDLGSREAARQCVGESPGEAAEGERGAQPARLHSPYHCGHHLPHQHTDEEASDHGPYPVNPVVVPVVCYQSWPKGSGRIHAGSGHATAERGTNQLLRHETGTHPPHCLDRAMHGLGGGAGWWGQQCTPAGAPCQGSGHALAGWQARTTPVPTQARLLSAWGRFSPAA